MQKNQNNPKHFSLAASQDQNEEVEISKSSFVELVQTLLRDQAEKETFFKVTFIVFISWSHQYTHPEMFICEMNILVCSMLMFDESDAFSLSKGGLPISVWSLFWYRTADLSVGDPLPTGGVCPCTKFFTGISLASYLLNHPYAFEFEQLSVYLAVYGKNIST